MDRTKILVLLVVALSSLVIIAEKSAFKFEEMTLDNQELIRLHIVANTNSFQDQKIKREVKRLIQEEVVEILEDANNYEQAKIKLNQNLTLLANKIRARHNKLGDSYDINLKLKEKKFPTRSYGALSLEAGQYQALEVKLGKAQGSNWWCVLFPPFCIIDSEQEEIEFATEEKLLSEEENKEIEYRFKLLDGLIENEFFSEKSFSLPFDKD